VAAYKLTPFLLTLVFVLFPIPLLSDDTPDNRVDRLLFAMSLASSMQLYPFPLLLILCFPKSLLLTLFQKKCVCSNIFRLPVYAPRGAP